MIISVPKETKEKEIGGHLTTLMSNRVNVEEEVMNADLVVDSVLIPGAKSPKLLSRSLVKLTKPEAAIIDISIDQGECAETSRPTSHHHPIYVDLRAHQRNAFLRPGDDRQRG
jgi:alanine dehydrogenase